MLDKTINDDLEIFTKRIMEDEGIFQYELSIEGQTGKGVNYGSEIVFFTVTSKTCAKKYNFVMKTTRRAEALRQATGDGVPDKREVHMYSRVFPALRHLLAECKCKYQLENVVKTFLINKEHKHETTIMEDLRANGYRLLDKQKAMNLEQIETVLSNYAKYHATSMALRVKNPQVFQELTKDMDSIFAHLMKKDHMRNLFIGYARDALVILKEAGMMQIAEKLCNLPEDVEKFISMVPDDEDRVVITHGDCWVNNMMFKYEGPETTQPLGVCFLDFQCATFGSPVTDLSYYIYASFDAETLESKFDELLRFYYDNLASTLKDLGLESEEVFTYDSLIEHWKKYAKYGLAFAPAVIKVELMNTDELPDIEKDADWSNFKIDDMKNNDVYKRRLLAVLKNYAKTCMS